MSAILGFTLLLTFGIAILSAVPFFLAPFVLLATWLHHRQTAAASPVESAAPSTTVRTATAAAPMVAQVA